MKDILTKLTESIGDTIANRFNKNEFITEKLHLTDDIKINTRPPLTVDIGDIQWKDILIALDKEDKKLLENIKDFIQTSDYIANKYSKQNKPKKNPLPSRSSSSRSSNSGWGNISCGRHSSSCSWSSPSYRSGC